MISKEIARLFLFLPHRKEMRLPEINLITLLAQVPLVGIFVWFALRVIQIFTDALDRRDETHKAFLKQQSEAYTAAIQAMASRFADEIRNIGKEVAELRGNIEAPGD